MNRPHNQQHLFMTVAKLMRNAAIKHIWRPVCWCWVKIPAPPPRVCRGCLCCSVYGSVVSYRSKVVKLRRGCCHHDHEHMHFRYGLLAYTGPRFQNGGGSRKALVCDSIRPSGMDLYYTGLPDEVSIISRINWYLDRSTALCCVSVKRNVHQDIWHQEGSVNNKNTTSCLHALKQRVCTVN